MPDLAHTLQRFEALMLAEQPVDIGQADDAIWAYLAQSPGLTAQLEALDRLSAALARMESHSPVLPRLREALQRHRARISEPSA
jgi:hypothetical protein